MPVYTLRGGLQVLSRRPIAMLASEDETSHPLGQLNQVAAGIVEHRRGYTLRGAVLWAAATCRPSEL